MEVHFLPQAYLSQFLQVLADHARVVVPVKVGQGQYKFRDLNEVSTEDVALEYLRTMVPPKKYFFPPEEVLYRYSTETGYEEPVLEDEPPILFGLHPCDLLGIRVTDTFFGDRYQDRHYLRRREQSRIIGLGCMPDEKCFCQSNRTDHIEDIYDLFLWEVEEGYLTLIRTPAGHEMLHWQRDFFSFASREHINQHQAYLERRREAFIRQMPTSDLPTCYALNKTVQPGKIWKIPVSLVVLAAWSTQPVPASMSTTKPICPEKVENVYDVGTPVFLEILSGLPGKSTHVLNALIVSVIDITIRSRASWNSLECPPA